MEHLPAPAAIRETHSAVVAFVGDRAYKLKKPVDLGFLDFRSRAAREAACHREVELNRRLAPDVYLGVADVVGPDGEVCDHLVVMRRMPEDRRLAALAAAGASLDDDVRRIAHLVAAFHEGADAPREAQQAASRGALRERWAANLAVLEDSTPEVLEADAVERVDRLALRYLDGRGPLFDARIAAGCARDGHGDLLADDIFCLDDGPRVLDSIEFDDALRYGDVLGDVAFLAMDLERLGRSDLAGLFLAEYRELTAAHWPASLAHHHIAYRAGVRAKVACIRHAQDGGPSGEEARRLLELTAAHLEAGRVRLVVVGGMPATGKSTVAAGVAEVLGAVHLRSDEVRKELAGLPAGTPAPAAVSAGIYEPASTDATYGTMLERGSRLLAMGESVVLDATFLDPRWRRAAAEIAEASASDLVELRCSAPLELAAARAARRSAEGADASDAGEDVVRALAAADAPWPTATEIVTTQSPDAAVAAAMEVIRRSG